MYEYQELTITPSYQRNFHWTEIQKARFIESILLARVGSMPLSEALESIRGLSFFEKKTQFEVQVFSIKKLEPRIESFRFGGD